MLTSSWTCLVHLAVLSVLANQTVANVCLWEADGFILGLWHDPYICLVASGCCVCKQTSGTAPILIRYVQVNWHIFCFVLFFYTRF
jgi:hypothetical protein